MNSHSASRCVALSSVLVVLSIAGCRFASNGPAAFQRSQQAAIRASSFTVEIAQSTKMGEFRDIKSIDCSAQYFHELDAKDLNDFAIEQGITQSQGRPRRHQESEMMFVGGKTYGRNTSSWENPSFGTDDASPNWQPLSASRNPGEECQSMRAGASFGFVAYGKILKSAKIDYLGKQQVNGHKCAEYQTSYPDRTYTDAKICLGTSDDLPYRVVGDDFTVTYNYDPVQKLSPTEENSSAQPQ
jgi:hypothetical protein